MSVVNPTVQYLATANDTAAWPANAQLYAIVVGTLAASAVVTVYDGASTSGTVLGIIDASAAKDVYFCGARFPGGLFVKLTGGNAKVSVVAG
jgi:hypothetical protein